VDKAAYDDAARSQPFGDLAKNLGKVDPIGRYSGAGTAKIEEIAFAMKDGQVSEMLVTPGGIMVIKRLFSIPAQTATISFESVKPALIKELTDRMLEQEIPKMFAKINEEAKPMFVLAPLNETRQETEDRSRKMGVDPGMLEKKK
jgi:parvulin-like peptidyl-prolyl isomerase